MRKAGEVLERNWRVLIADDDPDVCALIDSILRRGPYDISTCNDAESALVAIDRHGPFDIIICDFMLPGISGIDLIERLRASENTCGVPILMISGHTNYAIDGRAIHAGANLFLNKPFSISQLRDAVNQLLPTDSRLDTVTGSPANR
jgi:two-component system, OmpR family, response regulator CpxR